MKERLHTGQHRRGKGDLLDRFFTYILVITAIIGGAGMILLSPDEVQANWSKNDNCIQCHTNVYSGAVINVAVDGVETTSASIDNNGTDSIELDWMFEGGNWTSYKESVGVMMAIPTGWTIENGTTNSPSLTNWSSTWDNVGGGQSWVLMPDTKGDCPANHDCYSIQFTSPWDHDTADENMACNIGGTVCDGGSAGTDQDGVANRMGIDGVIKTSAGETAGAYTILVYAVGFDGNSKAYKAQTINVTVNEIINTSPDNPTNPAQYRSDGSTVISSGGYTEESTVKIEADISDPDGADTVKLQVDIDSNGSSDCESALVVNPSTNVQVSCSVSNGTSYNWQVRTVDNNGATSSWVAFAGSPDFTVDQTAPTGLSNASPANGATGQSTSLNVVANTATDSGSGSVQYYFEVAEDSGFSVGLQQSGWQAGTSYAPTLSGSTTYYWHVKARDALGNETSYTTGWNFTTAAAAISSGPNSAGTSSNNASYGSKSWSGGDVTASNNAYVSASNLQNSSSNYLVATNFGFAIPANATINGILVEIERKCDNASACQDDRVRIVKGGTIQSTDRASAVFWPTTDAYASYGGSSDLWGTTWTAANINASTFGVALSAKVNGTKSSVYADHIRITVYYTPSSNTNPDGPANLAQYRSNGSTAISSGGYTEESTVKIEADISDPDGGDTVKLQVDIDSNGSSDCESALVANPGTNVQVSCSASNGVSYNWQVRTVDNNGANSSWVGFAGSPDFTVDQTAPSYSWNTPAAGTWYKDGGSISVDVTITESGAGIANGANCNPKIDGATASFSGSVTYSSGTGKCTGTLTLGSPSSLPNGTHNLTVEVADDLGNAQQSANRSINIDNAAPTGLSNSSPANGVTDQATSVNVAANTATDAGSGSVQYYFEAAEDSGFSTGLQQSGWQAGTSYAPTLAEGTTYYWHVKAKDAVGNETSYTATWNFTTITTTANPHDPANLAQYRSNGSTAITSGAYTEEATVVIEADISDPDGGDTIKLQIDLDNNGTADCEEAGYGANPRTNVQVTCNVSDGVSYDWRVRAQDNNGANSNWVAFAGTPDFISDRTAPSYSWNTPSAGTYYKDGDNISVDATITESGTGITNGANCNPKIDGATSSFSGSVTYSTGSGKCTGTLTLGSPSSLGNGSHNLTIEVADNIGNTQQSAARSINIDNSAPTGLSNSSPANGATGQSISVSVVANTASDSGSGSVQYYFEVAEDSGFSTGLQQSGWQAGTSFAPTLASSTTYYWHVAASDAVGNATAYTATWNFTTGSAANPPDAPSDHNQYRNDGITPIAQGGTVNGTIVRIKATVTDPNSDDTRLEVEIIDSGSSYTGTPNCISSYVPSGSVASATCSGLSDGVGYKWRARTNDGSDQSAWQIFGGSDPDVTISLNGQFDITACSHCHATPPDDGTARDNPEGAVLGSHSISYHDGSNCGNCHVEPGAAEYEHRNGEIEMLTTIHGQTGSFYDKNLNKTKEAGDSTFSQNNSPTLGTCIATYCHGTSSDSWDTDLSAYDTCTKCHGEKTASPSDAQKAPGGSGVDTNGDSSNLDSQVGAHQVHLTGASGISEPLVCGECHTVPTAPEDAGHWDTSGARDPVTPVFNGPIGNTDGNDNPLTITYSSGQCSNTYCHDGRNFKNGWSTAAQIDFESPTWNSPMISTPDGDGICDNCHGYPPAGSHDTGTDCSSCHDHVDPSDDGFTGAINIAKHINHMVESSSDCMSCHNSAKTETYNTRKIVGAGGDFVRASRHVSNGTTTEIVTNYDCAVCHAEGDVTKINAGTGWTSAVHQNGSTANDRYVKLRNVDSYAGATFDFNKNVIDETMRDAMDTFCLNCHDVDGASTIAVNNTNDGLLLGASASSTTRQGKGVTTNLMPFNTSDNLRNARDGFTTRTRVVDVKSQYNTSNPSHHAVLGARYSTTDADWVSGTWTTHTLRDSSLPGGGVMNVVRERATLHCSDCHLSETNAHGAANAWHMLLNGTADDYASDQVMTGQMISNTASVVCYKCHNSNVYKASSPSAGSRFTHSEDAKWDDGTYGSRTADSAHLGPACLLCHAGDGFGRIHGRGSATDGDNGTYDYGGGTYSKYRFMPGAWMKWSPGGSGGTDANWDTSSASATCYFPASTETTWNSCNTHDGATKATSTNYDRARTY